MKKLFSILLAASMLLSLCSFAFADGADAYDDALQAVSEYCGGSLPEILYAEYYSIDDFEGKPLSAFLIQTASLFFAYCPESGALYAADSSVINSYCGALATEEDKCIYLLWTLSGGLRYLVNNSESRTVLAGEKPVSANELPSPAPQTPANEAPVPSPTRADAPQLPEGVRLLGTLPEFLTQRELSDEEISVLASADLDTLREKISCPADFAAWIDSLDTLYVSNVMSNPNGQRTFDPQLSFNWCAKHFGANMAADLACYILGDDYPGMNIVALYMDNGEETWAYGNLFSFEGVQYLISFDTMTELQPNGLAKYECFPAMEIANSGLLPELISGGGIAPYAGAKLLQAFLVSPDGTAVLDYVHGVFQPRENVNEFYTDSAALSAHAESLDAHIIPENISLYNISAVLGGPSLTPEEAYALLDMSPEEVQARVKTAADVLMYMLAARVGDCGGDSVINVNGQFWHHNLTAFEVMQYRLANCGASANLARYLLDGDYDEVGFILQAYPVGNGGGHVYSYILQDGKYYIIDYSWFIFGNYDPQNDFTVPVVDSLEEYSGIAPQIYGPLSLVFAHCSNGQHAPNIFGDEADPADFSYYIPEDIEYTLIYQAHERDSYILKTMPLSDPRLDWNTFG